MQLIGRDHELAALIERLQSRRLVTVVGPGGIGKTSLARAAARVVGDRYPLGAHFVDLTLVDAPDEVGGAIADQLGFPSFTSLLDASSEQPALVVVDNCEHVLDAAAGAISALLSACESPAVLATSRSPLELPDESLLVLGPLTMPGAAVVDPDVPSVRLFLERARDAGVELDGDDLPVIGELCRALDGLPLAIEMAAARTRVMTPAEILARLGDLDTLSRPRFRGAVRHRSLRGTIEWSYAQLRRGDQTFFDRLGVLNSRFDVGTAHAVAAEPGDELPATLESIDALVAASLLVADTADAADGASRYHLLAPLRTYALEQLGARGELDATWDRFADHVVGGVVELMSRGRRGWDAATLGQLLDMYHDIAAALRRSIEHDAAPDRAFALLAVLWGVVHQTHHEDVAALGESTLARWPEPTVPLWADAAATVATCRFLLGHPDAAIELAERALPAVSGSLFAPCTLRRVIGLASWAIGDGDSSMAALGEGAAEARRRGILPLALELDAFRAHVLAETGDPDTALELLRATRAEAAAAGSDLNEALALTAEGYVRLRRDAAAAKPVIAEALELARRFDYPACIFGNLQSRAVVSFVEGRDDDAADETLELIGYVVGRGALSETRTALQVAAAVLHRAGNPAWEPLAATAAAQPVVSMFGTPGYELLPLPPAAAVLALGRREAVVLARRELAASRRAGEPAAGEEVRGAGREALDDVRAGAPAEVAGNRFVLAGDVYDVAFAGRTVAVRASKGMADLARLLAAPGQEIHCLELAGAGAESGSTGDVIDAAARRRYEERIRELQHDIDEAEAANDRARAERAQVEFDAIVEHLTSALGLGGRVRGSSGSTVERARSAVTQRVRGTIKRLSGVHPELGRHLTASVTTGIYCSYRPEHATTWRTGP